MTANDTRLLCEALRNHYCKPGENLPGGAFLTEVQSPDGRRMADAVWLGFTRSLGWSIDVHELKVTRSDWLRELDDPTKSDAWYRHSTRWWVVVPHDGIVRPEELPDTWGLMVLNPRGRRFKVLVKPEVREPILSLGVVITLAKKLDLARANVAADLLRAEQHLAIERRRVGELERTRRALNPTDERRLDLLAAVEEAAGAKIGDGWGMDRMPAAEFGSAVRRALDLCEAERVVRRNVSDLTWESRQALETAQKLQKTVVALTALIPDEPKDGAA